MKIYNSLGGKKMEFKTLCEGRVGMYACGITPYSDSHLGHGVAAIRFNMMRKFLTYLGYEVNFVQNITNVDDKLIKRGDETGQSPVAIGKQYSDEYADLIKQLGMDPPSHNPDVISYIPHIINYVAELIELQFAYATPQGNVYFDVRKKDDYGKLSGRKLEDMLHGVRITNEEDKLNPVDFALWKRDNHPEMSWDSPWGRGRPGWHIECSVMSHELLGKQIDIHCGGLDLIFPHHENEIAQCEAHNGCNFVNYWVHSGLLNIKGQKMSKSLGNYVTLKDAIGNYGTELIKFVVIKHHYRSDINLTDELFSDNLNQVLRYLRAFQDCDAATVCSNEAAPWQDVETAFIAAMHDDFNTPAAMIILNKCAESAFASLKKDAESVAGRETLQHVWQLMRILGLFTDPSSFNAQIDACLKFQAHCFHSEPLTQAEISQLIAERNHVRANGNYERSDEIRDFLLHRGIKLLDSRDRPTTWQFDIRTNGEARP